MKFLIKGLSTPADTLKLYKAIDAPDVPVRIIGADGTPMALTSVTTTIEVYDSPTRKNAAIKSFSTTTVVATGGEAKVVPTVAAVNFGPGTYYMFAKTVDVSTNVTISDNYVTLKVS